MQNPRQQKWHTCANEDIYLTISASEQAYIKGQFFTNNPSKTTANGGKLLLVTSHNYGDVFDEDWIRSVSL